MSDATREQPAPTGQGLEVWPEAIAYAREYAALFHERRVLADMAERDAMGRERYGTPLRTRNGRSALVDAYQEALDLYVYATQAELEATDREQRRRLMRLVARALDLVDELSLEIYR